MGGAPVVKRDLRVLGAQRLECFDSTSWNRYYSMVSHQNDHNDYKGKMVPHQNYYNDYKDKHGSTPASILVPLMNSATQDGG